MVVIVYCIGLLLQIQHADNGTVPNYTNQMVSINRTASNRSDMYVNGISIDNTSRVSAPITHTADYYLGNANTGGVVESNPTYSQFAYYSMGSAMDALQSTKNTLVKDYLAAIRTPPVNELYAQDNVASAYNEVNNLPTTNISELYKWGNVAQTLSIENTTAYSGGFSIKNVSAGTGNSRMEYYFPTTDGETYSLSFRIKGAVGSEAFQYQLSNIPTSVTDVIIDGVATTDWVEYTDVRVKSGTENSILKIWNNGVIGNTIYIDKISIIKTN